MNRENHRGEVLVAADAKRKFRELGTCSRTFFYLLNREFGATNEEQERAADPLAGGIMKQGYQCGMLWGASLAIGAEAFKVSSHLSQAIAVSIEATKILMDSFEIHEGTTQCKEITNCNFESNLSFVKYMFSGRFLHCFQLAEEWAPEAIKKAKIAIENKPHNFELSMSCATEVAKKMGASEEEMVMVAGFAGGLALSGSACGALSATIWMNALRWCRKHDKRLATKDPRSKKIMELFYNTTDGKILCEEISKTRFESIGEHTRYLQNGGCSELINELSEI